MSDGDLVSIIVPVYDVEPYLDDCLESVTEQTYRNLQIILVDDGSPDSCPRICDDWAARDPRIRVVHQRNGGLSAARNTGLDVVSGRYVTFIDSDDVVDRGMIEALLSAMKSHGVDIAICGLLGIDECGEHTVFRTHYATGTVSGRDALLDLLYGGGRLPDAAWGRIYRTELIRRERAIRFPEGLNSEDYYFNAIAYHRANAVHMDGRCLYRYRKRAGSITASGNAAHLADPMRIADLVVRDLRAEGYRDERALTYYGTLRRYDMLFTAVCGKVPRPVIREYAAELRRSSRRVMRDEGIPLFRKAKIFLLGWFPEWYVPLNLMIGRTITMFRRKEGRGA
ncbi:glycosyltransferase family 2 protein [Bifidobacterium simiarum]|uniref:Glycosyl transferase family 2 n=1 Tax=Bifidobacterium simiarum TaxID=2045441 RepID=A0A2M9HEH6_9BIFI|nr:glycosyltransferase [Bifidobacterium simiarum]PJM75201.1 glycosyl transferase family 2 [Bifidobacterium simiarum]